jgi:Fur family peroxide stress response transcriptional regulator
MIPDKECGERQTIQRLKILEYLRSTKSHPTAETVYKYVSKELSTISLATVYRNLKHLVNEGKIFKIHTDTETRFDGNMHRHVHCICACCGTVIDVPTSRLIDEAAKTMKKHNFSIDTIEIVGHGVCQSCRDKDLRD